MGPVKCGHRILWIKCGPHLIHGLVYFICISKLNSPFKQIQITVKVL